MEHVRTWRKSRRRASSLSDTVHQGRSSICIRICIYYNNFIHFLESLHLSYFSVSPCSSSLPPPMKHTTFYE